MKSSTKFSSNHRVQAFLVFLTLVLGVGISWGQTNLIVNVAYDSSSSNPHTGWTTPGGKTTLRSAIQYANYNPVDTIFFQGDSTYRLTLSGYGHYTASTYNEDTCGYGDLDINKSVTIWGNGPGKTVVNGYDERVFEINPYNPVTTITVKIAHLTIRGGTYVSGSTQNGGGIEIHNANVILDTVYVDSNKVANNGGGIDIASEPGTTLTMNGGKIDSNYVVGTSLGNGGGGAHFKIGTVTLNNVEINRNKSGYDGGGLLNSGATLAISGGTISYNQAPNGSGSGGGINVTSGTTTISNCLVVYNSCPSGGGLGVYDNLTATGTSFKWNVANNGGAGLGGAIYHSGGALTLQTCIIDSNSADGLGGGLFIGGSAVSDYWTHVTIGYDSAGSDGAGVYDGIGIVGWHGDSLICNIVTSGGVAAFSNQSGGTDTLLGVGFRGNVPANYGGSILLPVEQTSLVATTSSAGAVVLTWQTATEIDNAGFNILRKSTNQTSFSQIASFITNTSLLGAGTSNSPKKYSFTDNSVSSGITYTYMIQTVSTGGVVKDGQTVIVTAGIPQKYALYQNFPNPFNPSTTIRFDLKEPSTVTLEVYNILGQQMVVENRGMMNAGSYNEEIDMSRFASGVYFYRIAAIGSNGEKFVALKRMMLVK